jgi:MinD superfamily P-loop ATPase containing an inserted ferredoxin domain
MILAIASGKGGTGKTTVAVNLARVLRSRAWLLDCDVEEPNAGLFLKTRRRTEEIVSLPVPEVDEARCDGCGECGKFCAYHAIVSFGTIPLVFPSMCHGCGGCVRVCPRKAIRETSRRLGVVVSSKSRGITLIEGRLDVGESLSPPLIRAVKAGLPAGRPAILDAPPGTSCPVVAAVRGADHVLLVTEPTPFGLHDLRLAVDLVRELGLPYSVVVNRIGTGDNRVQEYCAGKKIPVVLEIPDDRRIAEAYSRGRLIVETLPEYRALFERLAEKLFSADGERCGLEP